MSLPETPAPQQADAPSGPQAAAGPSDGGPADRLGGDSGRSGPDGGSRRAADGSAEEPGDTATAPAPPSGASESGASESGASESGASESESASESPNKPADAQVEPGGAAGGVSAKIPQPPTRNGRTPVDLLGSAANGAGSGGGEQQAGGQQAGGQQAGEQTASRREPSGARGGTTPPQLPVSDPDAPAWKRYAQRMTPPRGMPKIAVIVRGLGLSSAAAETAVTQLPASVSLAFTPYARDRAKAWAAEARRNGHEVLVDLPMEPADHPATDPGPQAIMTEVSVRENLQRLDWLLGQVDREVGAVAQMGSAVLANAQVVEPVLRDLKDRGLMFLDNGTRADSVAGEIARRVGLPFAVNDRTLDGGQVSRRAIEARLVEAERLAREQGLAVVMAHPYPVSLELLVNWTGELEARGFVLVPATYAAIARAGQDAAQLR